VFDESATTVGDVKAAGRDLEAPREAVGSSAETVVAARDDLGEAEQELADAQATLAAAQSGTSPPSPASVTTTTAPLLPPATVDRVQQAEADLVAASEAITDETPLLEAGTQFNAAAFALEIAWLRLFADAGCLTEEQAQDAVASVTSYTAELQTTLQALGYYDGNIDGIYGPSTITAVEQLQDAADLPVTGYVDEATAAALEAAVRDAGGEVAGDVATQAVAHTAAVQSTLKLAGYWTGPVDGEWTPELTDALIDFQTALGVAPTGVVDTDTLRALEQAIAEAQTAATSTSSPTTTAPDTATTATTVP
jgi:peptidoglycan hydrolase-like protein with peptidoglycan-binding domain